MEQRARRLYRQEHSGIASACALALWTCAYFMVHVSADTTAVALNTITLSSNTNESTHQGTLKPEMANSVTGNLSVTSPAQNDSDPESTTPQNLGLTEGLSSNTTPPKPTTGSPTTRLPVTQNLPTTVERLTTTVELTRTASTPPNTTNSTTSKTVTPAGYVVHNITGAPARTSQTAHNTTMEQGNQTIQPGTTSGSVKLLTSPPQNMTSTLYEASEIVATETAVANITDGEEMTVYVTLNVTTVIGGGPGLDPDHERDELKKLLLIIGGSIGVALVAIFIIFVIVYRVAKKRKQKANSRYYNFKKKKKSNYEKVLHLQEYYGELDTENSPVGTGAGWVFQENDPDANKTITLELGPKEKEKPASRSGKRSQNRNKNKNNRNKSAVGRGNYQVLAEMFPTRGVPPDVLLTADGTVHSNSEDEEGTIMDTSFGPVMMEPEDQSDGLAVTDRLSPKDSFNSGGRTSWPAWNNRPYVTIRPEEETVVEL
ncbi:uncharacterized protein LOC110980327 [Acanthaster planci]|uniref:Uncharacterized protein LOC110980327 n=1 Tax=Acanthaster planci TaxID=133434 RepID=A0A8B7YH87_ACAPL|nr:uncharacterized protein LOC110980327 [Acanthaster planci]